MLNNNKLAALSLATLIATAPLSGVVHSADTGNNDIVVAKTLNISGHAKAVVSDVRDARIALFDGQTDAALELVQKGQEVLDKAINSHAFKVDDTELFVLPIDRSITLAEDFKPTEALEVTITKAGTLAQQGKIDDAVVLMQEAGVDLDIQYVLLPVVKASTNLAQAIENITAGQYYEANMNLRAIEASITFDEVNIDAVPKQGYDPKSVK